MHARDYHERTKHSPASVYSNRHFLDWENQPRPFKLYRDPLPLPLTPVVAPSAVATLDAIAAPQSDAAEAIVPDLRALARLLHLSAGITRTRVLPGGQEYHFRAAACTGALYHIDLYLVCGPLPDLEAGVYHFNPLDFSLRLLRGGDYRAAVVNATADAAPIVAAPAVVIATSTFWRNAWKYEARAYRHCFWDSGTLLANLLAVGAADGIPLHLVLGFADADVNTLLGLDEAREVALALVPVGNGGSPPPPAPVVEPLALATVPPSAHEVDYPLIRAAHAGTVLAHPAAVGAWRGALPAQREAEPTGELVPLLPASDPLGATLDQTILRRGSARQFARVPITFGQLSTLLRSAPPAAVADATAPSGGFGDLYLIVNAVDGLPAGAYVYHRARAALELLRAGDFRRDAGFLDLGQELAADASVNAYVLADLEPVFARFGSRGYRVAATEAAITGGKLYLGAYALGLSATGLTFFDDDVTRFFSPHAAGKSVMFLVAIGIRRRAGRGQK